MSNLPHKIMTMVKKLHEKGYHDIYLYCGLSPSGLNWRFIIGKISDGVWPSNDGRLTAGSVRDSGEVEWSENTSSVDSLADDFVRFYSLSKEGIDPKCMKYVQWYSNVLKVLEENHVLVFYADYHAPHAHLLEDAPLYR